MDLTGAGNEIKATLAKADASLAGVDRMVEEIRLLAADLRGVVALVTALIPRKNS